MKYQILESKSAQQVDFLINENNDIIVDYVGYFSNLNRDFNKVCGKIGLDANLDKKYDSTNHSHYTDYYNKWSKNLIARKNKDDINRFGFSFEN